MVRWPRGCASPGGHRAVPSYVLAVRRRSPRVINSRASTIAPARPARAFRSTMMENWSAAALGLPAAVLRGPSRDVHRHRARGGGGDGGRVASPRRAPRTPAPGVLQGAPPDRRLGSPARRGRGCDPRPYLPSSTTTGEPTGKRLDAGARRTPGDRGRGQAWAFGSATGAGFAAHPAELSTNPRGALRSAPSLAPGCSRRSNRLQHILAAAPDPRAHPSRLYFLRSAQ